MKVTGERTDEEFSGEYASGGGGGGGGTVVVGVKLDEQSRELLTWALVKVAQSGDRVIAVHVLNPSTTTAVGKSTLLSLVRAFDSVLAAYEGFCHLKQVDLKLKLCRGSSVQKLLVREAKSYAAAKVIVGTSRTHHTVRSTVSVAKYCARKLPKDFCVLAVDNGRVVYQREASTSSIRNSRDVGKRKNFVRLIHRSFNKNSKVLKDAAAAAAVNSNHESRDYAQKLGSVCRRKTCVRSCALASALVENSCTQLKEELSGEDGVDNSLALVPIQTAEPTSTSNFIMAQELRESKPRWPLLRRMFLSDRQSSEKFSVKKISLVRWALKLPGQHCSAAVYPDKKHSNSDQDEDHSSNLDGENGAIVPVGPDAALPPLSPIYRSKSLPKELEGLHEKYSSTCRLFSYEELLSVTSNFMPEQMVGKGGSSEVYRGCLPDGRELAVKILKPSEDALKEFVSEIDIITNLHHKNIISLFGFCFEDNNLLLVYDFLSRGSLEENLHGRKKDEISFGWRDRYKVSLGVAEALDYLHNGSAQPVIHRDVKSSNILLSDDFEPQLSDFGLATWASTSLSHITCTDVAGTFGYLAPEYFMHGKVDDKIDVYAYGVVLLELLSGRKPINSEYPRGQESLVIWAKSILNGGKVSQLLDPSLGGNYDPDQIERMVLAATLCIRRAPRFRPQISQVLKLLQGDTGVTNWARQEVNALEELDAMDGEVFSRDMQSHLSLALRGLEDDSLSISSNDETVSVEDYLRGRWSRASSFD